MTNGIKKILVWIVCLFVGSVIIVLFKDSTLYDALIATSSGEITFGITISVVIQLVIYGFSLSTARYICKKIDENAEKNSSTIKPLSTADSPSFYSQMSDDETPPEQIAKPGPPAQTIESFVSTATDVPTEERKIYDPFATPEKNPGTAARIVAVISTTLCIVFISASIYLGISYGNALNQIAEYKDRAAKYESQIDALKEQRADYIYQIQELEEFNEYSYRIGFMSSADDYMYYHRYNCDSIKNSESYQCHNNEFCKFLGAEPCPKCYNKSFSDLAESMTPPTPSNKPVFTRVPVSVKNGEVIISPADECLAPFTVETSGSNNYYIYLDSTTSVHNDMSFFVTGGKTVEIEVPLDTYNVFYAVGETWFGPAYKFGSTTSYYKCDGTFEFYDDGNHYQGWTITLYSVQNGNMDTDIINAEDFPGH